MSAKNTKTSKTVRFENLSDLPPAPPLSTRFRSQTDQEIARQAEADSDVGLVPADFWDKAEIVEPDVTEQITLRLPRRVLRHFKATGKGYQTRISAVLSSYVDAEIKKKVS